VERDGKSLLEWIRIHSLKGLLGLAGPELRFSRTPTASVLRNDACLRLPARNRPFPISCQFGAAYASTLRIIIAYTCFALGTLVPYAEAANLLNASICVAIFLLILAKWVFQDSLLLSYTFKNHALIINRIVTALRRRSSSQSACAWLKCNNSLFSKANSIPVFCDHFSQILYAAFNRFLMFSNVLPIVNKFVLFANFILINCW
jgi:hypothetical protein